jgi:hypothetical protein
MSTQALGSARAPALDDRSSDTVEAVYRKVNWRIIPFLMLCHAVAFLDRINIGYAQLQMKARERRGRASRLAVAVHRRRPARRDPGHRRLPVESASHTGLAQMFADPKVYALALAYLLLLGATCAPRDGTPRGLRTHSLAACTGVSSPSITERGHAPCYISACSASSR